MAGKSDKKKIKEKRKGKPVKIEVTVGREIIEKMECILGILELIRKKVELPVIGKEKIKEAIALGQEIIDIMPTELATSILSEVLEGRESEIKIRFDELKLDGEISVILTPLKKIT